MSDHAERIKEATEALERVFADQSVDQEGTAESLRGLILQIEEMIESLDQL